VTEIFAHRGLHATERQNTIASFLEARAVGADGVELDVRRTRDGALVVHHDAAIEEVGEIACLSCRVLPTYVATLAEAMTACEGLTVNVEIKNDPDEESFDASGALAHQVVQELSDMGVLDRVVISSFDLATCEATRRSDAQVAVGWLIDWRVDPLPCVDQVAERGLSAIHPFFHRVDETLVTSAHDIGLDVNVWTVNSAEEMSRLFALGIDTLITDEPALALATLAATDARH
jgi:glycerophosphoryl diester phosphodiesterase